MNCNCREETEAKLVELLKETTPEAHSHKAELQGYGFTIIGNKMESRGFMEVKTSAVHQLKKGGEKAKTKTMSMFFSYCPFCGVKATKEAA